MSNRIFTELNSIIGLIYSRIPIKMKVQKGQTFLHLLHETDKVIAASRANSFFYDFNEIENLKKQKRFPKGALFNVLFDATPLKEGAEEKDLRNIGLKVFRGGQSYYPSRSMRDLTFRVYYGTSEIKLVFIYKRNLFTSKTIDNFYAQIVELTKEVIYNEKALI
jgi:hypothetical protein